MASSVRCLSVGPEHYKRKGYRIQFAYHPPHFQGVVAMKVHQIGDENFLNQELLSVLAKGAIEYVPFPVSTTGTLFCLKRM